MLPSIFALSLLVASSVVAQDDPLDDLKNAFEGLGLSVWHDILDLIPQTLANDLVDLLTGESQSNSRRDGSGRTFFVPE